MITSRGRYWVAVRNGAIWSLAILGVIVGANWVQRGEWTALGVPRANRISFGQIVGLVAGLSFACRSRRLLYWSLGPLAGFALGSLDRTVCCWLVDAHWSEKAVWSFPTFGLVGGLLAGMHQRSWAGVLVAFAGVGVSDFAGRWTALDPMAWSSGFAGSGWPEWISGSIAYAPGVMALLACARPARDDEQSHPRSRRRVAAALTVSVVGLFAGLWIQGPGMLRPVDRFPPDWKADLGWVTEEAYLGRGASLAAAFRAAGHRLWPQQAPPGRHFALAIQGYDPVRRAGFVLFRYDPRRQMRTRVLRYRDHDGRDIGLEILEQPLISADALILVLCLDDLDHLMGLGSSMWRGLQYDPAKQIDLNERGRVAEERRRAASVRRLATGFLEAVRDYRANPSASQPRSTSARPTALPRLREKYAIHQPRLEAALRRGHDVDVHHEVVCVESAPENPERLRVLLFHPFRFDSGTCTFEIRAAHPCRLLHSQGDRFWVNGKGDIIGDEDERPPDGYQVVEWLVPKTGATVRMWHRGVPVLEFDLSLAPDAARSDLQERR